MGASPAVSVFLLGKDYHLGDLLWLTAVLRAYREQRRPLALLVACPDQPISRILERNSLIDELHYGDPGTALRAIRARHDEVLRIHDLRAGALAAGMVAQWRRRRPWLYYRDLWMEPRGQWLATYLGLGTLTHLRPTLVLDAEDRSQADRLRRPYVVLAPHIGQYTVPLTGVLWQRVKGWPQERWSRLARLLPSEGYEPITLAAAGQAAVPGTRGLVGLPIRKAAAVIERAAALVSGESGLWFVAAALEVPFVIVPWWLPRRVDWAGPTRVPHRLVYRDAASVNAVLEHVREIAR